MGKHFSSVFSVEDIFNQLKTSWKKNKTKDYINSIHTFKEQVLKIYILSKEAPEGFSQR